MDLAHHLNHSPVLSQSGNIGSSIPSQPQSRTLIVWEYWIQHTISTIVPYSHSLGLLDLAHHLNHSPVLSQSGIIGSSTPSQPQSRTLIVWDYWIQHTISTIVSYSHSLGLLDLAHHLNHSPVLSQSGIIGSSTPSQPQSRTLIVWDYWIQHTISTIVPYSHSLGLLGLAHHLNHSPVLSQSGIIGSSTPSQPQSPWDYWIQHTISTIVPYSHSLGLLDLAHHLNHSPVLSQSGIIGSSTPSQPQYHTLIVWDYWIQHTISTIVPYSHSLGLLDLAHHLNHSPVLSQSGIIGSSTPSQPQSRTLIVWDYWIQHTISTIVPLGLLDLAHHLNHSPVLSQSGIIGSSTPSQPQSRTLIVWDYWIQHTISTIVPYSHSLGLLDLAHHLNHSPVLSQSGIIGSSTPSQPQSRTLIVWDYWIQHTISTIVPYSHSLGLLDLAHHLNHSPPGIIGSSIFFGISEV